MSLAAYDLTDLALFERGFPHDVFAVHRREAPVWWHPPTRHTPDGVGFWSVATHAESLEVLRDPTTYSSVGGGERPRGGTLLPDSPAAGQALNMMDDPRHQRVRRLVSQGFTPRMIAQLEDALRVRMRQLLDRVAGRGRCDFLTDIAAELPLQAITLLLGIPEGDRHRLCEWVDLAFDFRDRAAFEETEATRAAFGALIAYGAELVAERRRQPGPDLMSVVVHAVLPDETPSRLTDDELLSFFFLLFAAGADTTRNATAGGLLALLEHPEQLAALAGGADLGPAIEEMVRWTSPAAYNRRTVTRPAVLGGHALRPGDKVVFWEASANRDERVFPDAMRFDVRRDPNPHLGFGHGVHHCLGANLARLEMRVIFSELLSRWGELGLDGEVEWTRSNKHTGIRHLPIRFRERA
ncbi:MAG TPA: cytochrome P450 [Candidatus Limnocylindria bacterium]|nr:cytochrome P450 [Candidatus Limnocylindria bacterium]